MIGERTNVTGSQEVRPADQGREVTKKPSRSPAQQVAGGANVIDVNMDEALLDGEAVMTKFLRLIAGETEVAAVPVMVDSCKWSVIEAGLKCVQGKAIVNSISLKDGEEEFLRRAQLVPLVRRGGRRDGVRRAGPGGRSRRQGPHLPPGVRAADREGRLPGRGHHLRPEHPHRRHRHRGAQQLRGQLHRGDRGGSRRPAPARKISRRREQHLVLVPRQRRRPRGDARGVPVSRDPGRPRHGHRQRRPARGLRRDSEPKLLELVEDVLLNRRPDATERLVELRRNGERQGRRRRPRPTRPGATRRSRSGSSTRCSRASSSTSTKTPKKPGRSTLAACRSSKAR